MLIKSVLKLFSYTNRNRNRLLCFSTNCRFQKQIQTFPSIKSKANIRDSYYFNYLMSRADYYSSVYDIESLFTKNENDPEAIKLLLNFENSRDFPEKENCLNEVLKCTQNEFSNYSVNEICQIVALVSQYGFHDPSRIELRKIKDCIDQELNKKYFSKSEYLKILFTLSSVLSKNFGVSTYFYFHYKAVLKLLSKIDRLSIQEIVQTFYCIPTRNFSKVKRKFFILSYINDIISEFSSDELGIIAQGLVKGNMTFNHKNIFNSILNKTRNEIDNIHSVPFLSVCKALQKFFRVCDADSFIDFQEKLIPHVSKLDKNSLLGLVYAGQKYKVLNSSLKEILIKKWKECIMDFTPLEIVRFIHMTVRFNIQDEELLLLAVKNLETDFCKHHDLVSVLNNLSFHRLYPEKLLKEVFSEDFFKEVCSNNFGMKSKAEWWSLYCNVKLENPENDKEFSSSSLNSIYKKSKVMESSCPNFKNYKFYSSLYSVEKILSEIYGESKVFVTDVLPHFANGIVMRFNKELQAQEISEVFRSNDARCIKNTLQDNHIWIFVLLLKKSDFLWNTNILDLPRETQCRQLKALDYEILMVELSKDLLTLKQNNKRTYIANLMDACLKNISNKIK